MFNLNHIPNSTLLRINSAFQDHAWAHLSNNCEDITSALKLCDFPSKIISPSFRSQILVLTTSLISCKLFWRIRKTKLSLWPNSLLLLKNSRPSTFHVTLSSIFSHAPLLLRPMNLKLLKSYIASLNAPFVNHNDWSLSPRSLLLLETHITIILNPLTSLCWNRIWGMITRS